MAISLNPQTKVVSVTSPQTDTTIQEFVDTIRDWEDELQNMSFKKVINTFGKADLGGSVYTAITLTLLNNWQIQYWSGVGIGIIKGGNLVGGLGGQPVKPTGGPDTIIVNNQVGGIITVTGSGITDQDKLDIADRVWDELKASHIITGSTGEAINNLPSGMARSEAISGFMFMMIDVNGNPALLKTVSGYISKDGGTFASFGTIIEVGRGCYKLDLSSDNMDAGTVALSFDASGCRNTDIMVVTT